MKLTSLLSINLLAFLLIASIAAYAQKGGTVKGVITDKQTGETLPGATISKKGTSQGAVTDIYGSYSLYLPTGVQIVEVRYLGYGLVEQEVNIKPGDVVELNFALELDISTMAEIVVTAQAVGQAAAINQQINANTIVNVVSQDKIQELPDQNAAETLGRLSGISVRRDGGEGQQVVVRGLSPRFSSITINGERIPASGNDRSVDISMLSPDVLAGIEVFKALTPNLDADAIGGTVNFITKRAPDEPRASATAQYGYNALGNEWGQLRGSLTGSRRFFDNKLGLIVTGNYQRANRNEDTENFGWDESGIIIGPDGGEEAVFNLNSASLRRTFRDRFRYGGSATIDYQLGSKSRITLNSLLQYKVDEQTQYRTDYNQARTEYRHGISEQTERIVAANLSGEHSIYRGWKLEWRTSYNLNEGDRPLNHSMRFWDIGGSDGVYSRPDEIDLFVSRARDTLHVLEQSVLARVQNETQERKTENITAQADLTIPINITDKIGGSIRFGGKIRQDSRTSNETAFRRVGLEATQTFNWLDPEEYERNAGGNILINSFLAPVDQSDWDVSRFPFGVGRPDQLPGYYISDSEVTRFFTNYRDSIYDIDPQQDFRDYTVFDRISSGYLMATLKYNDFVTVVGGLRAENTYLEYTGFVGTAADIEEEGLLGGGLPDTTRTRSYLELFPQINVKIQPTNWFDIRVAATKSLTRPEFLQLVPWSRRNEFEKRIDQGNFDLEHTTAWNYDLFLSFYNDFGLLTVGGFYKELTNIDYNSNSRFTDEFGSLLNLFEPRNVEEVTTVQGIEVDMQLNFRFLPRPFDGIVMSANATFLESETQYPFLTVLQNPLRFVEDSRSAPLVGQPNSIWNLSLGYEKGGFTGRFSVVHQGETLRGINNIVQQDDLLDGRTTRLDLTFKQTLTENLKLYVNINNITNQAETRIRGPVDRLDERASVFGATADFGVQLRF